MIGMAKQQGTNVYVYSETGGFMFNKTGNLVGYTSNTVTENKAVLPMSMVNMGKLSSLNEHN